MIPSPEVTETTVQMPTMWSLIKLVSFRELISLAPSVLVDQKFLNP